MMVPLDPLFCGGYLKRDDQRMIEAHTEKPWCRAAGKIFEVTRDLVNKATEKILTEEGAVSPPDLLAVAAAIDPSIMAIENYHVMIETRGEYTRGMTVVDRRKYHRGSYPGRGVTQVVVGADQQRYARLVIDTLIA
jgi:inosine-uridine nucleoside N-ribohydrolase